MHVVYLQNFKRTTWFGVPWGIEINCSLVPNGEGCWGAQLHVSWLQRPDVEDPPEQPESCNNLIFSGVVISDPAPCRILSDYVPSSKCSVNISWWVLIRSWGTARKIFTSSWQCTHCVTLREMTSTRGCEELFVLPPILTCEKRSTVVWLSINSFYFQK